MAPSAADQDPKATHGSGELPSETASPEKRQAPLTAGSTLARLAGIGILLLGVVGAFLYLGGWFSPHKLTPGRFVDEFQRVVAADFPTRSERPASNRAQSSPRSCRRRAMRAWWSEVETGSSTAVSLPCPPRSRPSGC